MRSIHQMREGQDSASPVTSLRALLERQADLHGARPVIHLADASLTYRELDELADRVAEVLGRGTTSSGGGVVAALCRNRSAMLGTWLGCAKAGQVFLPVNPLLTKEPLRAVLAHSRAATVVVDVALLPALDAIRAGLPHLGRVLVAGGPPGPGDLSYDDLVEGASGHAPPALAVDPGAPAKLMYTSGTTGVPKGVVWSRACEAIHGTAYGDELVTVDPGEAVYTCLPLSHVTCQGTVLATLWRGGQVTVDDGFDAFGFWRRIRETDAVMFTFVGTILSVLGRRRPRPDDIDNPVRRILGAAAPLDLWHHVESRFGLEIVDVWGQTETASCWTMPRSLPQAPGTIGRETSRFEARLAPIDPATGEVHPTTGEDPAGAEGDPGRPGELWIRPTRPHLLFDGYLRGIDERGHLEVDRSAFTADGWYRTGDLATRTVDGDLRFTGRIREAIRRRGEMISSSDIEAAARAHHGVAEAAAVGVPADDGVEQEIKVCVVPHDDTRLAPAHLHDHLRRTLPKFMVPRYVDVRPELPKTPSTRVRKFALEAEGTEGSWDARRPDRLPPCPPPHRPNPPERNDPR